MRSAPSRLISASGRIRRGPAQAPEQRRAGAGIARTGGGRTPDPLADRSSLLDEPGRGRRGGCQGPAEPDDPDPRRTATTTEPASQRASRAEAELHVAGSGTRFGPSDFGPEI